MKMYYSTSNEKYLEYLAYQRYPFQSAAFYVEWSCPANITQNNGCNCPKKLLPCGCTICENVLRHTPYLCRKPTNCSIDSMSSMY